MVTNPFRSSQKPSARQQRAISRVKGDKPSERQSRAISRVRRSRSSGGGSRSTVTEPEPRPQTTPTRQSVPTQTPTRRSEREPVRYVITQDGRPIASREAASFQNERAAASFERSPSFNTDEDGVVRVTETVGGRFTRSNTSNIQRAQRNDPIGQLSQRQSIETTPLRGIEIIGGRLQAPRETRQRGRGRSAGGGRSIAANIPPSTPASFQRNPSAAESFVGRSLTTTTQNIESRTPIRSAARGTAIGAAGFLTGGTIGAVSAVAPRAGAVATGGLVAAGVGSVGLAAARGEGIDLLDTAAFATGFGAGVQPGRVTGRQIQATARRMGSPSQNIPTTAFGRTTQVGRRGVTVRSFAVTQEGTPAFIPNQMGRFPVSEVTASGSTQLTLLPFAGRARRGVSPQEALRLTEPTTRLDQTRQLTRLRAAEQERALKFYQTTPQRPGSTRQIGLRSYEFVPIRTTRITPTPTTPDPIQIGRIKGRRGQFSITRTTQRQTPRIPTTNEIIQQNPLRLPRSPRTRIRTQSIPRVRASTFLASGGLFASSTPPQARIRASPFTSQEFFSGQASRTRLTPIQEQIINPLQGTDLITPQTTRQTVPRGGTPTPLIPRIPQTPTTTPPPPPPNIIPGFPSVPDFGLGSGRDRRGRGRSQQFGYTPSLAASFGFTPTANEEQDFFTGIEVRGR